ncbi:hypothetical protein VKT23_005765 [Stygiomarasmius scandens]|uniref:Nucleolar 27S pre-rRNA processing Urb2/Npa2 C-terminal domain-containing protein n=1 Tax=Marasmiellus scandens TaxID=2682957 RepID=A0ABR1JXF0_9AGAR
MFQTTQDFVRALKSSSDPPAPDGPTKIEIARASWDDSSLYAPRKGEVIADWILGVFLKEKDRNEKSTFLDNRYWTLLQDVISPPPASAWLPSLLSRIPLPSIIVAFFYSLDKVVSDVRLQLLERVRLCLAVLWPLSVQKTTAETLLECAGAFLHFIMDYSQELDEHLTHIGVFIFTSLRRSLATSSSKKKAFSTFIKSILPDWMKCCTAISSTPTYRNIYQVIYASGVECLFNLEILRDPKLEESLFDALGHVGSDVSIDFLPHLYLSHVESLRKNRGVLLAQDSKNLLDSLHEYRSSAMRIFESYNAILLEDKSPTHSAQIWRTRSSLLDLIDQQRLFNSQQSETVFKTIIHAILFELASDQKEIIQILFECLVSLVQIDYRLIEEVLPDIISRLLFVPHSVSSAFAFLELLLHYHTKTRTLDTYIERLLVVCSALDSLPEAHEIFPDHLSGNALLHPSHLDKLSKAIRDFLPSTQTSAVVQFSIAKLEEIQNDAEIPLGKGKTNSSSVRRPRSQAMRMYAASAVVGVVLSSFSLQSVTEQAGQQLTTILKEFESAFLAPTLLRRMNSASMESTCAEEATTVSLFRLQYAVHLQRSKFTDNSLGNQVLIDAVRRCLSDENVNIHSDIGLEMLRICLAVAVDDVHPVAVFDRILKSLEDVPHQKVFPLLHMLLHRWLAVFDSQASEQHLQKLVIILTTINGHENSPYPLRMLVLQLFCMAEFWELPRLRAALLSFVDDVSAVLDRTELQQSNLEILPSETLNIISIFKLLLITPSEYLSRSLKVALVRRAGVLDNLIVSASSENHLDVDLSSTLYIIRGFVSRVLKPLDPTDSLFRDAYQHLKHLQKQTNFPISPQCEHATITLAELYIRALLKQAERDHGAKFIQSFLSSSQTPSSPSRIMLQCFNLTVGILQKEYSPTQFSEDIRSVLFDLANQQKDLLVPKITLIIDTHSAEILTDPILFVTWNHVQSLRRWLDIKDTPMFGRRLITLLSRISPNSNSHWQQISTSAFDILLGDFHLTCDGARTGYLDIVVAAYVLLYKQVESHVDNSFDGSISTFYNDLPLEDFAHVVSLICDALSESDECSERIVPLVHLATLLIRNPPQNSSQPVQTMTLACANIFNDRYMFTSGPLPVRLSALEFIVTRCRDRPTTLRLLEVSNIWALITKITAGSVVHDQKTSTETFHNIVSIASSLIRLRRDLVVLTIPHLGIVLRRLISIIKSPRTNLGARQNAIVSKDLPVWVNASQPFGIEEGKALARLLESLATKTIPKTHASFLAQAQKAEPLAKPFSKHASYVLKAYVEVVNDSLCTLPIRIRKELQPGIYALCGMMTDHARDALMASMTESGEKLTLKQLWQDYEKQKYTGKG